MSTEDAPQLHAVIEVPADVPEFVGAVPARPWPSFVRLHSGTPQSHIALVVGTWAQYPHLRHEPQDPQDLAALIRDFPRVAPGGLAAVHHDAEIAPSCCCGLEGWREWERLLTDGQQPWLGHDPSPWVEVNGREFTVWSDGGDDGGIRGATSVRFTAEQLQAALQAVERDLVAFGECLRRWPGSCDRRSGEALVAAFTRTFIANGTVRTNARSPWAQMMRSSPWARWRALLRSARRE
jgi:hypothetical protein